VQARRRLQKELRKKVMFKGMRVGYFVEGGDLSGGGAVGEGGVKRAACQVEVWAAEEEG